MIKFKVIIFTLFVAIFTNSNANEIQDLETIDGNWHLRVLDGKEVRRARAILDFKSNNMYLEGFDSCNRIWGKLLKNSKNQFYSQVQSSKMDCRENIHKYVSHKLHTILNEGFTISRTKRYGINGITLKSEHHNLFFKQMGE